MANRARWPWLLTWAVVAAVAFWAWRALWFLSDDAYINFRYVANAHAGYGLVWNPPPFQPVEGYTGILWLLVLWATWSLTGVEPPVAANWIALAFGLLTLAICLWAAARLAGPCGPWRLPLAALCTLGIAANPTFAAWTSSGMETAMFGTFAVGWTLALTLAPTPGNGRRLLLPAALAALAMLTRPEGALFAAATALLAGLALWRRGRAAFGVLPAMLPLLLPVAQVLWRHSFYGAWLPNTYYAKVVAAWPESGLRWLFCFAVENGLLVWSVLALVGGAAWWVRQRRAGPGAVAGALPGADASVGTSAGGGAIGAAVAVGTWLGYVGFYALRAGGDHFEYRPLAALVPLLFLSALALWRQWTPRPLVAGVGMVLFAALADPLGWCIDRGLAGRETTGFVAVASSAPAPLRPLLRAYDRAQAWLRVHFVGMRRALHASFCQGLCARLPARGQQPFALPDARRVVVATVNAGVISWVLPDAVVLDVCGLNDRVIARNPVRADGPAMPAADLAAAFAQFDADRDGRLSRAELRAAVAAMPVGSTGIVMPPEGWADVLLALHGGDDDTLDAAGFAAAAASVQTRRHMAHEREPPPGYLQAFRANVFQDGDRLQLLPDAAPLTDAEIVAIETEWWARITAR